MNFLNWIDICFSLFFKKLFFVFFELFLDNLNDIFINSLDDFLFLDDAFDVINAMNWDVLDVSVSSSTDDDLNCS